MHAGVLLWIVVVAIYMAKRRTARKRGPLMTRISSNQELRLGRAGSGDARGMFLAGEALPPPNSPFMTPVRSDPRITLHMYIWRQVMLEACSWLGRPYPRPTPPS